MFFESINAMLNDGDTLVVMVNKGKDGLLNLTITPKGSFKNANLGSGLSVQATPEQLDRDLASNLGRYTAARKSLEEQIEAAAVVLESASREVAADAVKQMATKTGVGAKSAQPKANAEVKHATPASDSGSGGDDGGDVGVSLF